MPTYKSISGRDVITVQNGNVYTFGGDGLPSAISEILNPLPTALLEVSQNPTYQPILASWVTTASGAFAIPVGITTRYNVNLYCASGQFNITFNGNGGQPLIMGQYFGWTRLCQTRTIDVINVVEISAGSLYINIEAI